MFPIFIRLGDKSILAINSLQFKAVWRTQTLAGWEVGTNVLHLSCYIEGEREEIKNLILLWKISEICFSGYFAQLYVFMYTRILIILIL